MLSRTMEGAMREMKPLRTAGVLLLLAWPACSHAERVFDADL